MMSRTQTKCTPASIFNVVFLLLALVVTTPLIGCNGSSSSDSDSNAADQKYKLGVLLPLTGDLQAAGETFKAALEVAAAKQPECQLVIKDSEGSGITSQTKMAEFKNEGIDMIIGPAGSEPATWAKDYADQNGQTLLSCSASAVSLGIPADSLFRLAVSDEAQADVLTQKISEAGITHVAIFLQPDVYGQGLYAELTDNFNASNINVNTTYNIRGGMSEEAASSYFLPLLENATLAMVNSGVPADQIGVVLLMYEQAITLLQEADNYQSYNFAALKWFGTDAIALSTALTDNATAASFARRANLICSISAEFANADYAAVKQEIQNVLGEPPSVYAVMYHDALLIVCDAIERAGTQSSDMLRPKLRESIQAFDGASSPITLNPNDDRSSHKLYDFWKIEVDGGRYSWSWDSQKEAL